MFTAQGFRCWCSLLSACVAVLAVMSFVAPSLAQPDQHVPIDADAHQLANDTFRVRASTIQRLTPAPQVKQGLFNVPVQLNGQNVTLQIKRTSIRSEGFKVLVQVGVDQYIEFEPGEEYTVRGTVLEMPDAKVSGTLQDGSLYAVVWGAEGFRFGLEPLASKLPALANAIGAESHVVYRLDDVIGSGGVCGNEFMPQVPALPDGDARMDGGGDGAPPTACTVRLAIDADFEYYQLYGTVTNVINRVHQVVNAMNPPYETQVGLTHIIPAVIVRIVEPDPYTSSVADTLLCQFITHWTNTQQAIGRDVATLFTGRDLDGTTIGRAANFGEICDVSGSCGPNVGDLDDGGYCIVQADCCGSLGCAADLVAHELGHLWSATHCDPCNTTMRSTLNCALTFSQVNINQINTYRNSVSCPSCTPPTNNSCANARNVFIGSTYAFSTYQATTDGPNETQLCNSAGFTNIENDIWFRFTATCSAVSIDVCDATFDTKIALYNGTCPSVPHLVLACNDDACGSNGFQSRLVSIPVVQGNQYLVRVGGFSAEDAGSGVLRLLCAQAHDECANALNVGNGNHPFSTANTTSSGPNVPVSCGFTTIHNDLWYRYVANCDGIVTFSLCGSSFDTRMALYTGSACGGSILRCNDDDCGTSSRFTAVVDPGDVFYVRIGSNAEGVVGTGTLSITCAANNDNCNTGATFISGGWFNFSTLGTTTDGPDEPGLCNNAGFSNISNDIWYTVIAQCTGPITVSVCQSNFDTKLAVYGANCPVTSSAIACNDDGCGTGLQSSITFNAVASSHYKIRIGGFNGAVGSGVFRATCCPGDIATPAFDVGVSDLLEVINMWGPCPSLPTICKADINGDLAVNVSDLLIVINSWGPCPN